VWAGRWPYAWITRERERFEAGLSLMVAVRYRELSPRAVADSRADAGAGTRARRPAPQASQLAAWAQSLERDCPIGDGKSIPPTGKRFALSMATIAQRRDGKIAHDWLFCDNHDFMKQIGLAQ
jgi:hypothetical protein